MSILFASGSRPAPRDIVRLLTASIDTAVPASISHHPGDEHGWLELLASGLTFELAGLAPGPSSVVPLVGQVYGLPSDVERFGFEAISLSPGPHIAAGAALMPIMRILTAVAANLALQLPVTAVCWNPAQTWMEPKYFGRVAVNWLAGGAFPVLGFTRVGTRADGSVESAGLAHFTGQEARIAGRSGEAEPDTMRLATRVIADLLERGPLRTAQALVGPAGEALLAEPSPDGTMVLVSRRV
jgi:hypothetical protein